MVIVNLSRVIMGDQQPNNIKNYNYNFKVINIRRIKNKECYKDIVNQYNFNIKGSTTLSMQRVRLK